MKRFERYEDRVRGALNLAREIYEVKEIAQHIGCRPQTLSTFLRGGPLGHELIEAAAQFARAKGFWIWDTEKKNDSTAVDASLAYTAHRLSALAEYLTNPKADGRDKIIELESTLTAILQGIDRAISARNEKGHSVD